MGQYWVKLWERLGSRRPPGSLLSEVETPIRFATHATHTTIITHSPEAQNGAAGVAIDAGITINFSEAVNVAGSWFSIVGSSSGSHTATVSGGPQNFLLNPDVDFSDNETITITIFAANVTDQDANDLPDNMTEDYTFSFSTITVASNVVINELDSDTPGADVLEFVELYDGGAGNTALDGLVVVFYNGLGDVSYSAFNLDGFNTDANGYFLLGNSGVAPTPSIIFGNGVLQNGADAVALYVANASSFPSGAAVTTTNLVDAVVYDTDDADDPGLLVLLNAGQPQVNENGAGDVVNHSSQRIPNGSGGARNTDTYAQFPPTPGAENVGPPPPVMAEIFEIQGSGFISPLANQTVITANNVVTAVASNGFAMQTPEARADADVETSNGIFVFTGSAPTVSVGDFNAYQFTDGYVDAVGQIAGSFTPSDNLLSGPDLVSPDLTKQVLSLPAEEQYSFIFDGSAQVLDHMLTSQAVKPTGLQYGRGNSDAAETLIEDDATPLRSSDHDGLVLYLDVVPPAITITGSPSKLWPPHHAYQTYDITDFVTAVTDGGTSGLSPADVFIVAATSDEAENAPGNVDGNTTGDIVIVDCQTIKLRAERADNGNGRVYTVNVAAEDASGNLGSASFQVHVPLSQSGTVAADDGSAYAVPSACSAPALSVAPPAATARSDAHASEEFSEIPVDFGLEQNFPNPFNPETAIRFQLPEASHVVIQIYNTLGREIVTLVDGQYSAGSHRVRWNGRNSSGEVLASGVYFYQLRAGSFNQVRRMNLLR